MVAALELDNVAVARGERTVVAGVSFSLAAGEAMLLKGPNGSGKTTLIRAIAGLLPVADGRVVLTGGAEDVELASQCHLLGHTNAIKPALTVRENLAFWHRFLGGDEGAVARALTHFQLEPLADIPAALLSAGQKRRTGLARLLVAWRPLWLLDEPTTSLDTASAGLVALAIEAQLSRGGLVLVATHLDMGLASPRELALGRAEPAEATA